MVPNYNSGPVLERALVSLFEQNYPDLQLIVADSESRDISRAILERYRDRIDVLLTERDEGQADGLNRGFAHADGEICGWLCADDELLPNALERVAAVFRDHPEAEIVTGGCERVYPDGSRAVIPADPRAWEKITVVDVIEQPSTFWRAGCHRRLAPLDTSFHLAFDWDLWCRMRNAGAVLEPCAEVLSRYHFSATNKSGSAGDLFAREAFRILRRYGPLGGRLAYVYRFLYRHFDLKGCYDQPRSCSAVRFAVFSAVRRLLRTIAGHRNIALYNWHFAACQQRRLRWW